MLLLLPKMPPPPLYVACALQENHQPPFSTDMRHGRTQIIQRAMIVCLQLVDERDWDDDDRVLPSDFEGSQRLLDNRCVCACPV